MLTAEQKLAAQAIINVFETGKALGDYGRVAVMRGDAGHLSYGKAQVSLASGNLLKLIREYCADPGSDVRCSERLKSYLPELADGDYDEDGIKALHDALRAAGSDPVMRSIQDAFFDAAFWAPAVRAADREGIETALGHAIVYDGHIQGSWGRMRDRVNALDAPMSKIGEKPWLALYVSVRRKWLATHKIQALHPTVYRMDAFRALIEAGNWGLELPFTVRGVRIDREALGF